MVITLSERDEKPSGWWVSNLQSHWSHRITIALAKAIMKGSRNMLQIDRRAIVMHAAITVR